MKISLIMGGVILLGIIFWISGIETLQTIAAAALWLVLIGGLILGFTYCLIWVIRKAWQG